MLTIVLLPLTHAFAQSTSAPNRCALLVAVTRYEDDKLNTPPMKYPEADATELAQKLKEGGYEVEMLLGEQATQETIRTKLSQLGNKGNADGAVILGFFGHGVEFAGTEEAMYCPYGTTMRFAKDKAGNQLFEDSKNGKSGVKMMEPDPASLVGMGQMLDALRLSKAVNKLLLADCCRKSPNAARGRRIALRLPAHCNILIGSVSFEVACFCASGPTAQQFT